MRTQNSLKKDSKIELTPCIPSDHNGIKRDMTIKMAKAHNLLESKQFTTLKKLDQNRKKKKKIRNFFRTK